MTTSRTALLGARVFDGESFLNGAAVLIDGAKIAGICAPSAIPSDHRVRDLGGGLLSPGFIDVQVNGGGGALLNEQPTLDGVRTIAESHRRYGTVGLMPTVITDAQSVIAAAIAAVEQAVADRMPGVLGIHVEGPFLDVDRKGAHVARFIREMAATDVAQLAAVRCRLLLTLAPNRVVPAVVRTLAEAGVVISLGHAEASHAEACAALDAGATGFTHLYNAMSQLAGREPGMAGAALSQPRSFAGLIADGHHVHDAALQVAYAAKGADRLMLVTDAMPSAAGGPARFELQGRTVRRENGRLTLDDGTLAGSDLSMDQAVRYCVTELRWPLGDVLRMASRTPATFLGLSTTLGRIAPGYLASLVHLRDDLTVQETWIEGR
jgi:N-acetylglucosamine-6-phosphate deacetylase